MPETVRIFPPSILFRPTQGQLEFRLRFGLGRFFGPWTLPRQRVTKVYREQRGLNTFRAVGILGTQGLWWSFYTYQPDKVLRYLEELGYPVEPGSLR